MLNASFILIVGRPHSKDTKLHKAFSESLTFPSTHINVPRYAVTYLLLSTLIFDTVAIAEENSIVSDLVKSVFDFELSTPNLDSSLAITNNSILSTFPSAAAIALAK